MRKSNSTFNFSFFLIGILFISQNFNSTTEEITKYGGKPESALLEMYGKQVFENEKCSRCHVLNIEDEKWGKKSLDGYGGSKTSGFIAELLFEPENVNPGTRMPSFKHLLKTPLEKEILKESFKNEAISEVDFELAWKKLNLQADSMTKKIKNNDNREIQSSEAVALIGYLQSIPTSKAQKEINNIQNRNIEKEPKKKFIDKSDKVVQEFTKDKKTISLGKEIYGNRCAMCHGDHGEGMIGPNLTDNYWIYGSEVKDISNIIINGTQKGMPASKSVFTTTEIGQVVTYLMEIKGTNYPGGKAPEGRKE
ncbi:c-type cytochrome [Brumimicrobium mesophilum]|uniref:c-type cytochrome n=1 Tax=Brumimicrobium mesophilum TaxID=392717 RepID=UPI000D140D81|nr:c-type cytochrome [Brumimicrobium mesophilum]